jgi:hypothetical protein
MVKANLLVAAATLFAAALLSAGCGSPPRAPAAGWYAPPPPPLSCAPGEDDVPCVACAKAFCCEQTRACEADARCRCLLRCANRPWPFSECAEERCGPANDLYRAERGCLSASCAMCPSEHR